MKLKALEIQGFKSFADKIKLNFDSGITAVVGPNGSGKSNIADAVRWVLGEQSVKTLRGQKMEDIIFNGTKQRNAQGVAAVTLVIDNSDKSLPFDSDEIFVSRKLYRSGESEYRINDSSVRLKDIYELFMDTGIGRDGYAIIGQGKVAEIVSARSRERREIFEEAAGISKFRYRKQEAEKQLSLSEENLSRLLDIKSEIEGRLEPLKIQSEKAKKYLSYAQEKKQLDISLSIHQLSFLNKENFANEDRLIIASNQHDEAKEEFAQNEEEYSLKLENSKKINSDIEDLRAELSKVNDEVSSLISKNAVINNDIEHFKKSMDEISDSLKKSDSSKEELLKELESLKSEKEQKLLDLCSISDMLKEKKQEKSLLDKQQSDILKAIEDSKIKRSGIFEAIEKARVNMASSKSVISESTQRLCQIDSGKLEFKSQIESIKRELLDCDTLSEQTEGKLLDIDNEISGYILKRQSREKKLSEKKQRVLEIKEEIHRKEERARLLEDMENSMDGFVGSVKLIMKSSKAGRLKGIIGTVSSLLTTDEKYSTAIEISLGASLQNIVTENSESAKSAIFLLKNQKAGRATFLPIDTIKGNDADFKSLSLMEGFVGRASELISFEPRFKDIFSYLLGRIIIAEDLDHAMAIAKKSSNRYRVVTLDGQVINAGGSMTGGFVAKSSGLLSRRGEIQRLKEDSSRLAASIEKDEEDIALYDRELIGINAEINACEERKKTLNEDMLRAKMQEKSLAVRLAEKERSLFDIEKEQLLVEKRIEELKGQDSLSDNLFESLNNELNSLQASLNTLGEKRDSLRAKKEQLLQQESNDNAQLLVLKGSIENFQKDIQNRLLMINSNEDMKKEGLLKLVDLKKKVEDSLKKLQILTAEDESNRLKIKALEKEIEEKIEKRKENDSLLALMREKEKEISQRRDSLYKEVMRLSQIKEKKEEEISAVIGYLYDSYEMTLSMAEQTAQKLSDIPQSQKRLTELKLKIKGLGNVNLEALEEYKEVKARYDEMSRQIKDITSSKEELNRLISELTDRMRLIFSDKFKKISENFSVIFRELFKGGQAHLTLTEPENILESGIEISAAPPGKVIKNLSSLSGGEQSFVAIAIFFAILKVNPSPFCLMDEIEAALDDVNVNKFASYLHTLTDKTQFITITHRRGTMEEADVLYGVTMQEEGVSKLLRLDVSNIQKDFYK